MVTLHNIAINLRATGPAAVVIVWLLCFTAVVLFGSGGLSFFGVGALGTFGALLIRALAEKIE